MILHAHPTGNANVRALHRHWQERGRLAAFLTTIAFAEDSPILAALPRSARAELARRRFPLPAGRIARRPVREVVRHLAGALGWEGATRHEHGWASIDAVYRDLDAHVAARLERSREEDVQEVYLYEDGAATTFAAVDGSSIGRHYDLPTGYWRAKREILAEEAARNPAWAPTLSGMRDSREKLERKDRELALADHVVVASSFTRETLARAPDLDAPVSVVPYGAPPPAERTRPYSREGPLRVLFVGALTQQKGLSYLFEAVEGLDARVRLTLIGRPRTRCPALDRGLEEHEWIPGLPHENVLEAMGAHDVLVFPTLFDGFGLVLTEALSRGTPVIATRACAAPDLITDGREGFLVPPASAEALEDRILQLARDRERLAEMGRRARRTAEGLDWARYASEVTRALDEIDAPRPSSVCAR